jgi:pyrroloquinoline quinone (PQQ) biosynthesis protein C
MDTATAEAPLLTRWIQGCLELSAREWSRTSADYSFRQKMHEGCQALLRDAYQYGKRSALAHLHEVLAFIYAQDFGVNSASRVDCETQPILRDIAATLEQGMLEYELRFIPEETLRSYPRNSFEYARWLRMLISAHRASAHPLYTVYMPIQADAGDLKFFLAQETNLDPRFDDILALIQVGTRGGEKLEIANNYYDEMGNGRPEEVHAHMFNAALQELGIDERYVQDNMLLDGRISGNLSACLALSRRHYYKAIGYFGVTEYLAPRRFKNFVAAWRRNGLSEAGIRYHDMHIKVDAGHARGWFENVIKPLMDKDDRVGREIALGAMIRLNSSERYLDALLAHFESKRDSLSPMH